MWVNETKKLRKILHDAKLLQTSIHHRIVNIQPESLLSLFHRLNKSLIPVYVSVKNKLKNGEGPLHNVTDSLSPTNPKLIILIYCLYKSITGS